MGNPFAAQLANEAILLAEMFFSQPDVPLHHSNVVDQCHSTETI